MLCQFRFNIHKFTDIWPRETVIKVLLTATASRTVSKDVNEVALAV